MLEHWHRYFDMLINNVYFVKNTIETVQKQQHSVIVWQTSSSSYTVYRVGLNFFNVDWSTLQPITSYMKFNILLIYLLMYITHI